MGTGNRRPDRLPGPKASSRTLEWTPSTPITLDYAQLKQYEAVADGAGFLPNIRPIQPLDGRTVNPFDINVNYGGGVVGGASFTFTRTAGAGNAHATRVAGRPGARRNLLT